MGISLQNTYEVDKTKKEAIDNFTYSDVATSGKLSGIKDFAGISPTFSANGPAAIRAYMNAVKNELANLTALSSSGVINGIQVETAIKDFITAVKNMVEQWLDELQQAENNILAAVTAAYQSQDSNLSGDLGTDSSTVKNQSIGG